MPNSNSPEPEDKYPKPKILLIDMPYSLSMRLTENGFNVSSGTFGSPYSVERSIRIGRVQINGELPLATEQEIVIANLGKVRIQNEGEREQGSAHAKSFWCSNERGIIDPRPVTMNHYLPTFDRILAHGGIFILSVARRIAWNYHFGTKDEVQYGEPKDIALDSWGILSILARDEINVEGDPGEESQAANNTNGVSRFISQRLNGCGFDCSFSANFQHAAQWQTIALNKYGKPIAGILRPTTGKGLVILLPSDIREPDDFFNNLLTSVLPEEAPDLFPYAKGSSWSSRPEYALPKIAELRTQINAISEDAQQAITALESEISTYLTNHMFLYKLLQETGRDLVIAVKETLEFLGFKDILDVDIHLAKEERENFLGEDLQVRDQNPLLLVEIKGINGCPTDEDALQVQKYLATRMRELKRFDLKGLSIINHERSKPPLNRATTVFRDLIKDSAIQQHLGLMTTWNLFKLSVNLIRHNWHRETITSLLYSDGPIDAVPSHFEYIGDIEKYLDKNSIVCVRMKAATICIGDRIAYESPIYFFEEHIVSLQVDGKPVEISKPNDGVGIKSKAAKTEARPGSRVFRIKT